MVIVVVVVVIDGQAVWLLVAGIESDLLLMGMLFCPTWILLAQELTELLPAATNTHHDVPSKDPNKYNELITDFVLSVAYPDHRELGGTSALA